MAKPLEVPPNVGELLAYRSVWVLAGLNKDGTRLKGQYYAVCVVMGRPPLWAVFDMKGRLKHYSYSKSEIKAGYSEFVWRRVPARWQFMEINDVKRIDRDNYLLSYNQRRKRA